MPETLSAAKFAEVRRVLLTGSRIIGLPISSTQIDAFLTYLSLLLEWNKTFNLTSVSDPILITRLHFLDSLAIAPFLNDLGPLIDIGSGAGFPGMPLKIVLPDLPTTLVEPRRKRANFLRTAIRTIKLNDVTVIENRIEQVSGHLAGSFSTVALRAVGDLDCLLSNAYSLLKPGGQVLLMHGPKGNKIFSAIKALALGIGFAEVKIQRYEVPLGTEVRTLLILSR